MGSSFTAFSRSRQQASEDDPPAKCRRISAADRVHLNVGGMKLETTWHTLRSLGNSYFTKYFETLVPTSSELFIDTSPDAFQVLFRALLVGQRSVAGALRIIHEGLQVHGDVLRHLLDFLLLNWTLGEHFPLPARTLAGDAQFFFPGKFLDQEYISIESGLRSYGATGGVLEHLRCRRLNPAQYEISAGHGEPQSRRTVHVSVECSATDSQRYEVPREQSEQRAGQHSSRVAFLSPLYNDGDQDGSSLDVYLEEACLATGCLPLPDDEPRHDDFAVSRLVFDLGRHFLLRISGAVISLTCTVVEPFSATVRLDVADSRTELLQRPRLGRLAGDLTADLELLPNYGIDESGEFHYRHSVVQLTVPVHEPLPMGRLLALQVWGRDGATQPRFRWRLSALEIFGDLIELPNDLAVTDTRPPFCFDGLSQTCRHIVRS